MAPESLFQRCQAPCEGICSPPDEGQPAAVTQAPEFDSWLQVVDSKEEKIATTNGSSQ